jgi:hypothetical protein
LQCLPLHCAAIHAGEVFAQATDTRAFPKNEYFRYDKKQGADMTVGTSLMVFNLF